MRRIAFLAHRVWSKTCGPQPREVPKAMIAAISCVCIYRHIYISFYLQPREVPKAMTTAYLLWFFFGLMGAHRYENICIYVCIYNT